MFKRKIYEKLLDWKKNYSSSKALLIEGARRIGKSTVVKEFAKNEYKSFIVIDFNEATDIVFDAFMNYLNNLDVFFMILSAEYNTTLYNHNSLIVFDEVQQFPRARQAIKYLIQDGRFDYIETGSLISILENVKDITIPSEEKVIKMYPMDFEEFSWAVNENNLIDFIKLSYKDKKPLPEKMHHKAMLLLKQYMLIGGMPKVVDTFLQNNRSFIEADKEKRDILNLYLNDISKADKRYRIRVKSIFEQIPSFLSKHEKRIRTSNLGNSEDDDLYNDSFYWLKTSMMVNECFLCNDPNVGLSINEDRKFIKCYMGDTGLLISLAFNEKELADGMLYKNILNDKLSINEGMLFENMIAQILASNDYELFFYTKYNDVSHRNDMKIDFILSNGSKISPKIYPIEVKSTKRYETHSLDLFKGKYKKRIGENYVIHPKNFKIEDDIIYLPAYMAFCL